MSRLSFFWSGSRFRKLSWFTWVFIGQYFGHLMQRTDSFEKTLMERLKEGGARDDRGWMTSPTWWTWVWVNSGSWWWTGRPGLAAVLGVTKSRTRLSHWTELLASLFSSFFFFQNSLSEAEVNKLGIALVNLCYRVFFVPLCFQLFRM